MTCLLSIMIVLRVIQSREYTHSVTSDDTFPKSRRLDVFSLNDASGNRLERKSQQESVSENALFRESGQQADIEQGQLNLSMHKVGLVLMDTTK